jgi:thioredoxin 1
MATIELTKDNFEEVVTGNDVIVVDFWAPWCGPCKGFAPVFEAASEKHPGVVFAKVNTDEQQELAGHFAIRSIPTISVFREKVVLFSQAGALPAAALDSVIEQAQALDMKQVHEDVAAQQKEQEEAQPQAPQQDAGATASQSRQTST